MPWIDDCGQRDFVFPFTGVILKGGCSLCATENHMQAARESAELYAKARKEAKSTREKKGREKKENVYETNLWIRGRYRCRRRGLISN